MARKLAVKPFVPSESKVKRRLWLRLVQRDDEDALVTHMAVTARKDGEPITGVIDQTASQGIERVIHPAAARDDEALIGILDAVDVCILSKTGEIQAHGNNVILLKRGSKRMSLLTLKK
jgi:hypothetical protein